MTELNLEPWHDFYVMLGGSAAALVGATFVVATLAGNMEKRTIGIKGFAAAMLGGCGNIPGAIAGGFTIGVLDSFAAGHFQGYSELVVFLVFTVAIMIRPTGLFGETTVSRA